MPSMAALLLTLLGLAPATATAEAKPPTDPKAFWAAVEHVRRHGVTDHPVHLPAERMAATAGLAGGAGQPVGQPPIRPMPLPPVLGSIRMEADGSQQPWWLLTAEGLPCHLTPSQASNASVRCSAGDRCCLDPQCTRQAQCGAPLGVWREMPLAWPRDQPQAPCSLPTLGNREFQWQPSGNGSGDGTTVFILEDSVAFDPKDFGPLLQFVGEPVDFVWLSYSAKKADVMQQMVHLQAQLRSTILRTSANASGSAGVGMAAGLVNETVERRFHFVLESAWHISTHSCWLPSVIHAWSRRSSVLSAEAHRNGFVESVLPWRTATRGVVGSWAPSWGAGGGDNIAGPLRWLGLACEEDGAEDGNRTSPAPSARGMVALVERGGCSFYRKVRAAHRAGAAAAIIFTQSESPFPMGCAAPDPCEEFVPTLAVMVGFTAGKALLEAINATGQEVVAQLSGELQGPSHVGVRGGGGGIWAFGAHADGLQGVAQEVLGMEHQRKLSRRRAELEALAAPDGPGAGAAKVKVFELQRLAGSLLAPWPPENAVLIREGGFDLLDMELQLDCKDHLDEHCGPWDFKIDLYLCGADNFHCSDSSASLGRWITPYGREARWLSDNTAGLPRLLQGAGAGAGGMLHMKSNWWQAYTVTLTLWFHRAEPAAARGAPVASMPLWEGGDFDAQYNSERQPQYFEVPPGSTTAMLSVLLTGHGWGLEEANCAEYCDHTHHFRVNGEEQVVKAHPRASTNDGCSSLVPRGVVPNQYGTWPFGRAGWCPGMQVEWWEVDVSRWLLKGMVNNITYSALFNGTDYLPQPATRPNRNGFPAKISLASFLTFYNQVQSPSVQGTAEAKTWRKRPTLLL